MRAPRAILVILVPFFKNTFFLPGQNIAFGKNEMLADKCVVQLAFVMVYIESTRLILNFKKTVFISLPPPPPPLMTGWSYQDNPLVITWLLLLNGIRNGIRMRLSPSLLDCLDSQAFHMRAKCKIWKIIQVTDHSNGCILALCVCKLALRRVIWITQFKCSWSGGVLQWCISQITSCSKIGCMNALTSKLWFGGRSYVTF